MCHCADCQRRTGSAFSVAVFYPRPDVRVANGTPGSFERAAPSGYPVQFHFCIRCGASVYWERRQLPELVGVARGAFADPGFPQPSSRCGRRTSTPGCCFLRTCPASNAIRHRANPRHEASVASPVPGARKQSALMIELPLTANRTPDRCGTKFGRSWRCGRRQSTGSRCIAAAPQGMPWRHTRGYAVA